MVGPIESAALDIILKKARTGTQCKVFKKAVVRALELLRTICNPFPAASGAG